MRLTSSLPGMLHARIQRSPYPHVRIRSVNASATEHCPGVRVVNVATDPDPRAAALEAFCQYLERYRDDFQVVSTGADSRTNSERM